MPFARAFLFLTMGSFLFILNQTLSGLNSWLIAVKQTANIYLTVKLEYHFQSIGCTHNPRLPEAVHKNQRELVRTKIWAWNQKSLFRSKGTCNWFFKAAEQCGFVWPLGNESGTEPHVSHPGLWSSAQTQHTLTAWWQVCECVQENRWLNAWH